MGNAMKKQLCKLTDKHGRTYNNTQWGPGVTHTASGEGGLCGPGWIHLYEHPLLAAFLNLIHAGFKEPILWSVKVAGKSKNDHGLKLGYTSVTTVRKIKLPQPTTTQRVAFGILCALELPQHGQFVKWATAWLDGKDRDRGSAKRLASGTARSAARSAAVAAAAGAVWACGAGSAAWAVEVAALAAESGSPIGLVVLAKRAMKVTA
jgi:hypothetical protein